MQKQIKIGDSVYLVSSDSGLNEYPQHQRLKWFCRRNLS